MGFQNVKPIHTLEERNRFIHYILQDIKAMERMLEEGLFEKNTHRVGAEQEFCILDEGYRPSFKALEILERVNDPHFTTELALFNLEINLDPFKLESDCFSKIKTQLQNFLDKAHKAAADVEDNKILLTGILPTLTSKDLIFENMTPFERYRTLNKILTDLKKEDFRLYIKGVDELFVKHRTILYEACNTSFQIHLQIDPDEAVQMYNWAQMISAPVLAIATNSPLLMNRELWSETRIALFQQSIDTRNTTYLLHEERPRVGFGHEWVQESILEVFKDDVARYPALMTTDEINEDSIESLDNGIMPQLQALNLHNGTIYKWNRLCYGVHDNIAHLRIENRYIPSGPTIEDEMANMLFWVGLMRGMPNKYNKFWETINFKDARGNFYNAAKLGLEATFNWFDKSYTVRKLIKKVLIPMAKEGLQKHGVDQKDIAYYLGLISERIKNNINGSKWITRSFRNINLDFTKDEAAVALTKGMYERQIKGMPVSQWKPAQTEEGNDLPDKYDKVGVLMNTHLFAVNENDPIKLVLEVARWKDIEHLPVVNKEQNIVGSIAVKSLKKNMSKQIDFDEETPTKDIMSRSVVMVTTDTPVERAKSIFKKQNTACLFIMENNHLVGIFTKDMLK